jgi:hypothetical protein
MKQLLIFCLMVWGSLLSAGDIFCQNVSTMESVEITEMDITAGKFSAEKEDDEFDFYFNDKLKIKTKKGKTVNKELLHAGMLVDVTYELADTVYQVQKIVVLDEQELSFAGAKGYFDYQSDSIAFVGGKKVMLPPGVVIYGDEDKACKCKGYIFKNFQHKPLTFGYTMTVKGKQRADGVIVAEKVTACKSVPPEAVANAIAAVSEKYNGGKLVYNRALGIYKGHIMASGVKYQLFPKDAVQEYVTSIGNKLLLPYLQNPEPSEQEDAEEFKYRFMVVDNEMPEAFSWPNGMVFINTGLLRSIANEAQLAFVIARELAHINYQHTARRLQKAEKLNITLDFVKRVIIKMPQLINKHKTDTAKADSAAAKTEFERMLTRYADGLDKVLNSKDRYLLGILLTIKQKIRPLELVGQYTKAQEAEADEVALSYMYIAGFDIREAPKLWDLLLDKMKKPSFKAKVSKEIRKMIPLSFLESFKGDIKTLLISKTAESLICRIFESAFNAPKLTRRRLERVSRIVQANYPDGTFTKIDNGAEKYAEFLNMIPKEKQ